MDLGITKKKIRMISIVKKEKKLTWISFGKKNAKSNKHKSLQQQSKPLYLSNPYVNHMLVQGNFKTIVELPKYVDVNEWLSFNSKQKWKGDEKERLMWSLAFEFFNHLNLFYGSITTFCTPQACPTMSAGPGWGVKHGFFYIND